VVDPAGVPVRYGEGPETTMAYLAEASAPRGGVVLVHDWYGHLPNVRDMCDALAESGMTALAPDLYDGKLTADEAEAAQLFEQLDVERALSRLLLSVEQLRGRGAERIGLLGFSTGGYLALRLAGRTRVDALVAYYAALAGAEREPIGCPVQLHLAEYDHWESADIPDGFIEWLAASGTPAEVYRYPGAHHGFANPTVSFHRPGSRELSWARTVRFLGSHLVWRPP
jgi:carboxymethylenebutenolidase